MATFVPTDPLWSVQWYLRNTGQRGGDSRLDLNVQPAWNLGFTGKGIRVAINDDGMDLTHPDLVANIDATKVYDTNRNVTGQGFVTSKADAHEHGTVVGAIVGMAANSLGGIGIAYQSTLIPAIAVGVADNAPANASARVFAANIAADVHVSVNSWGNDVAFAENFGASGSSEDQAWGAELTRAATIGRNGLGMILEVSAGNERGNRADAGLSNFTNNKVTIAVGAVDQNGVATDYSTPGASLLVTAFGGVSAGAQSEDKGFGIFSADIQGERGYNKTAGAAGDYAYQNQGTSYSGPMVGAAAALMLEANPNLGFRDVSTILAATARKTDAGNASWTNNGATDWNLGGMHFSRDYGYGLVDIAAAVRLAQSWNAPAATMANWTRAEGVSSAASAAIPDDATQSLTVTAAVADTVRIDRVEFDLDLQAASPSQLKAEVTSPSGTTVVLFDRPLTRALKDGAIDPAATEASWPSRFTIGSTAFMGETSAGTWTLKITDMVSGTQATYNSLNVRAFGAAPTVDNQYLFSNEFTGSRSLTDASGRDTLNFAALEAAVRIDLTGATPSTVGATGQISLSASTVIEIAIGGAGNDTLIGNAMANLLRGNEGRDTLTGGGGADSLRGGLGDDMLLGEDGTDFGIYGEGRSLYTITRDAATGQLTVAGPEGTDTLRGVERLVFSDRALAFDLDGAAGQAFRLFKAAYGRAPDAAAVSTVLQALERGVSGFDLSAELFRTADVLAVYSPSTTNEAFVSALYRTVLGRDGEAAGTQFWLDAMANKNGAFGKAWSRADLLSLFAESVEHKVGLVGTLDQGIPVPMPAG